MVDDPKVQAPMNLDSAEVAGLKAQLAKANSDHDALKAKADKAAAEHKAMEEELTALKIQFKLAKPKYVWKEGDSECEPVVPGAKCKKCGWEHGDLDDNGKPAVHPIAA